MKVSLVIPAKNEKESLGKVLTELKQYSIVNDIIIIVDSKKDNSIKIVKM
jgi:glycosyltransferase involved in cell wall biosynthesis